METDLSSNEPGSPGFEEERGRPAGVGLEGEKSRPVVPAQPVLEGGAQPLDGIWG